MNKLKRVIASVLVTLGITFGAVVAAPVAFAAPAQAVSTWTWSAWRCDYVYVYRHYDYDWWEETFQGKRDRDQYLYKYYQYNWTCHTNWYIQ